jgi:hypothetical protein
MCAARPRALVLDACCRSDSALARDSPESPNLYAFPETGTEDGTLDRCGAVRDSVAAVNRCTHRLHSTSTMSLTGAARGRVFAEVEPPSLDGRLRPPARPPAVPALADASRRAPSDVRHDVERVSVLLLQTQLGVALGVARAGGRVQRRGTHAAAGAAPPARLARGAAGATARRQHIVSGPCARRRGPFLDKRGP